MELQALIATVDFAARKHKDQRRKDIEKTPYINHPIGTKFYNALIDKILLFSDVYK